MSAIKGAEYPLYKIFSSQFDFHIPPYQRPYAWTEQETGELFDDLHDFYISADEEETYFLGSVVLVKEDDDQKPLSQVIDGQQRLTTLTILLAVLASRLPKGPDRVDLTGFIIEPGSKIKKLPSKPRLHIRDRDNDFFKEYVQDMGFEAYMTSQGKQAPDPNKQDTDAKANIIQNTKLLYKRVKAAFQTPNEIIEFSEFLVTRCFLVTVTTSSEASAFRVFSVLNNRGMSLLPTDIIKADVIGKIPDSQKDAYTDKWEEMEIELGRDGFLDLFGQIRMITMKAKAKKTLLEEFRQSVLPKVNAQTAVDFIDKTLTPYADAYSVITANAYADPSHPADADAVNALLRWLNRIDNSDWLPVAMLYYVKNGSHADDMRAFLKQLERLAAYMRTTSWDVNHRIERYAQALKEIETAGTYKTMDLSANEKIDFWNRLNSDIYTMTPNKRNYLILRLDSFVSDGAATYDSKVLTIEHVLPQTVPPGSDWARKWPVKDREQWLHKIANLLPLSRRKNAAAQNYPFADKKKKYFQGKSGTTSYALTTQVLNYADWTPDVVKKRQKDLLKAYEQGWDL